MDHIFFKVEILSNEDREWHESFSLVLGPDDPVEAVLGDVTTATVTILDQEAAGSLILPAPPIVSCLIQRTAGVVSQWPVDDNRRQDGSQCAPLLCASWHSASHLFLPFPHTEDIGPCVEAFLLGLSLNTGSIWWVESTGSVNPLQCTA